MVTPYVFDRVVSSELLSALTDGPARRLVERRTAQPSLLDVQLRREQRGARSWASFMVGLTSILDVDERNSRFRLRAHATHRAAGGFESSWSDWQQPEDLAKTWPAVEGYVDRLLDNDAVARRLWNREGRVHAGLSACVDAWLRVFQREASVSFSSRAARNAIVKPRVNRIVAALKAGAHTEPWWPGVRDHGTFPAMGIEADGLAFTGAGQLAVIEAKPGDEVAGITFAAAQVRLYAELFALLLSTQPDAQARMATMLTQRIECGLSLPGLDTSVDTVVPVVAIGSPITSPHALDRLAAVAAALDALEPADVALAPLEVWLLDEHGTPTNRWHPSAEQVPHPTIMSKAVGFDGFRAVARTDAVRWKQTTPVLPDDARAPGPYRSAGVSYAHCLPVAFATDNLLPEARAIALERFAAAGIPWHGAVEVGVPSTNLLSSQVQCANTLAPLVADPDGLQSVFGSVLPIAEVIPFGATTATTFDATDHVVFEWIGTEDHLGERDGKPGTRGANTTSADAAIRYHAHDGATEIALIEWKYTERYPGGELHGGIGSLKVRHERYRALWDDPDSPVRHDVVDYDDLFVEPVYQLFRLQLLAWRMEATHELGAQRVRVCVVYPSANIELAYSFNRPSHRFRRVSGNQSIEVGSIYEFWRNALRRPDRFTVLDSAHLLDDTSPVSSDFRDRYRDLGTATRRAVDREPNDVLAALQWAWTILSRVGSEGGVLAQLLATPPQEFRRLPPALLDELAARAWEVAELTRRLRAVEVADALDRTRHSRPLRI